LVPIGGRQVPVCFARNDRARRYILRVQRDGSMRVTIPRRGSIAEGMAVVQRHGTWIESQLQAGRGLPGGTNGWFAGTEILFRGERVRLHAGRDDTGDYIQIADQRVHLADAQEDARSQVEGRFL